MIRLDFKLIKKLLILIDSKYVLNKLGVDGNAPVHVLFQNFNKNPEVSKKFLGFLESKGANINIKNELNETPLFIAVKHC